MALVHALAAAALLAPLPSSAGDLAGRPDTKGPTASSKTALPTVGPYRCNTPTDSIYELHRGARHTFKKLHIVSAGDGAAPTVSAATSDGPFSPAKVVQAGVVRGVDILEWQGERFALGLTPSDHMNAGVVVEGGQPLERDAAELTRSELHGDQHGRCRGAYALLESPQQRVVDFCWFEAHSSTIGTASNTPVVETMFSDRTSNPNVGLGWVFWVAPQGRWFSSLVERADSERDQLHIPFAATLPTKPSITHNRGMYDTLGPERPTDGTLNAGSHFVQAFIPGGFPAKNATLHVGDATYPMAWNYVGAMGGTWYVVALNPGQLSDASSAWMEWSESGETRTLKLDATPGVWSAASRS